MSKSRAEVMLLRVSVSRMAGRLAMAERMLTRHVERYDASPGVIEADLRRIDRRHQALMRLVDALIREASR